MTKLQCAKPPQASLYGLSLKAVLLCTFVLFNWAPALAQEEGRTNEDAIKLQELLIEASREKVLGNYESAAKILESVLEKDAENSAASFELARAYEALGETQKCLSFAEKAVKMSPDNTWFLRYLADIQEGAGQYKKAAATYERIVALSPNDEQNHYRLALMYVRAREIKLALGVYDDIEKKYGISEELVRKKHALYVGRGDDKKAAQELQRLIEAFPANMGYRHLLAGFFEQIGDQEAAREVYQSILQLDPGNAKAQMALAGQSAQTNEDLQFIRELRAPFLQADADIDLKIARLRPFLEQVAETGDSSIANAALELSTILEEVHPFQAKSFAISGDFLFLSGRKEEALPHYQKALELDKTVFMIWEQVMYIYEQTFQFEELANFSEACMDYFPNQPVVYYMNGLALYHLERYPDALSALRQGAFMAGGNTMAAIQILTAQGLVYEAQGKKDKADAAFGEALGKDKAAPPTLSRLASVLAERGENLSEAVAMAQKAVDLQPGIAEYEANLGWALYQQKDYAKAQQWLTAALGHGGQRSPNILERAGDTAYQLRQAEKASRLWKEAVEAGGASKELLQKAASGKLVEQ